MQDYHVMTMSRWLPDRFAACSLGGILDWALKGLEGVGTKINQLSPACQPITVQNLKIVLILVVR